MSSSLVRLARALRARALGSLLGAGVLAGCTELAPGSDVASERDGPRAPSAAAVVAGGPSGIADAAAVAGDTRWACLEQPGAPRAVPVRTSVELTLAVTEIASLQPPRELRARACSRLDVSCEAPLASAASDGAAPLRLRLEQGFSGFVEITSESSVPALYFPSQPLDTNGFETLFVISPTSFRALAEAAGVRLEAAYGHLLARAFDCEGEPAPGVRISNGEVGTAFSFQGGLPRFGTDVTSSDGLAGHVNVPPGLLFVEGREQAEGRECGTASLVVRGGWLTYGDIEPAPR